MEVQTQEAASCGPKPSPVKSSSARQMTLALLAVHDELADMRGFDAAAVAELSKFYLDWATLVDYFVGANGAVGQTQFNAKLVGLPPALCSRLYRYMSTLI